MGFFIMWIAVLDKLFISGMDQQRGLSWLAQALGINYSKFHNKVVLFEMHCKSVLFNG